MKSNLIIVRIVLTVAIMVSIGTVLGATAYLLFLKRSPLIAVQPPSTIISTPGPSIIPTLEPTVIPTQTEKIDNICVNGTFTNTSGGYSFDCFPEWKFAIGETPKSETYSLFGSDVIGGGVGVIDGYDSIDDYLKSLPDITFTNKKKNYHRWNYWLTNSLRRFPSTGRGNTSF